MVELLSLDLALAWLWV